jgi:hypothetical protein
VTRRTKADLERELAELRAAVRQKDEAIAQLAKALAAQPPSWGCPLPHFVPWPARETAPAAPPYPVGPVVVPPIVIPMQPQRGPFDPPFYPWEITCGADVEFTADGGLPIAGNAGCCAPLAPQGQTFEVVMGGPSRPSGDLVFGAVHNHIGSH